jgi:sugar phosphate isomerase/epimerase
MIWGSLSATGKPPAPHLAVFPKGFFEALVARRMTLASWIALAGSLGVDGVELHPAFFDAFDSATLADVRRHAAACGLQIPMFCHSPDFTHRDPAARSVEVTRTADMFRVTAELGGTCCRVLSGQDRPGLDEAEALGWVTECLEQLEPRAKAAGVVMCLENHYRDDLWTYPEFAQAHSRYLAVLDALQSPWLGAQYDPSNAIVAGEDQYALLARVLPRVVTVHASDRYLEGGTAEDLRRLDRDPHRGYAPFLRHGVIGRGLNDYDRIFTMLANGGFNGWISIEDGAGPTLEVGMQQLRDSVTFVRAQMVRHWPRTAC